MQLRIRHDIIQITSEEEKDIAGTEESCLQRLKCFGCIVCGGEQRGGRKYFLIRPLPGKKPV
jgi:hypothetical protein